MAILDMYDAEEKCEVCKTTMKLVMNTPKQIACPNQECKMHKIVIVA